MRFSYLVLLSLQFAACSTLPFSSVINISELVQVELLARDPTLEHRIVLKNESKDDLVQYSMVGDFEGEEGSCKIATSIEKDRGQELQDILYSLRVCQGNSQEAEHDDFKEILIFKEKKGRRIIHKRFDLQASGSYQYLCRGMPDLYDFLRQQIKKGECPEEILDVFFYTGRKKGRRKGTPDDGKTIKAQE